MNIDKQIINNLYKNVKNALIKDRSYFYKKLKHIQHEKNDNATIRVLKQAIDASVQKVNSRLQSINSLKLTFNTSLPVNQKLTEIENLISDNQIVIIAADTGSGKTTQIPKICLKLGLGACAGIVHTQPRRMAARSVAMRIAQECETELGKHIGFQVRFDSKVTEETVLSVVTDGVLLSQLNADRLLKKYDTIIIDEAHERSLNIDFLLGAIKMILPKRPELKLIITSATIDVEKFSCFFNNAPILHIEGRSFDVDIWYRPLTLRQETKDNIGDTLEIDDLTINEGIVKSIQELELFERQHKKTVGDILVFLSGEREIKDAHAYLQKIFQSSIESGFMYVLPLYARLNFADQQKIFSKGKGRKVVLSTNIAETSITVSGIRYVIDSGLMRISRYSNVSKLLRLPIEPISKASANQRAGRAGRLEPGICIRLYEEDDFIVRPDFTDPEILRVNLASVILQLQSLQESNKKKQHLQQLYIYGFPLLDRPEDKFIKDGVLLLQELNALNSQFEVTAIGRQILKFPIDPRLSRILLSSIQQQCFAYVSVIVSALSVVDVRIRNLENKQKIFEKHKFFTHENSEFVSILYLWYEFHAQKESLSKNALRKWCTDNFLNYQRILEWALVHRQIVAVVKESTPSVTGYLDLHAMYKEDIEKSYRQIHLSLLSGFLSQIGTKLDTGQYQGVRNKKFMVHASTQIKTRPKWLLAASIIETSNYYATVVAQIEAEMVTLAGSHVTKTTYAEPFYDAKQGSVVAHATVSLYGLVLTHKQLTQYNRVNIQKARYVFIKEALVAYNYIIQENAESTKNSLQLFNFLEKNKHLFSTISELENKLRATNVSPDEQDLFEFYHIKLGSDVCSTNSLRLWLKHNTNSALILDHKFLYQRVPDRMDVLYPDYISTNNYRFSLKYEFDFRSETDGITVYIPVRLLSCVSTRFLSWTVPGLLKEKIQSILSKLPKQLRITLSPIAICADIFTNNIENYHVSIFDFLIAQIKVRTNTTVDKEIIKNAYDSIEEYLKYNVAIVDDKQNILEQSRNLEHLYETYADFVPMETESTLQQVDISSWSVELETHKDLHNNITVTTFHALTYDEKTQGFILREYASHAQAITSHREAIMYLIYKKLFIKVAAFKKSLQKNKVLLLPLTVFGNTNTYLEHLILLSVRQCFMDALEDTKLPCNDKELDIILESNQNKLAHMLDKNLQLFVRIISKAYEADKLIRKNFKLELSACMQDAESHLYTLVHVGFLLDVPYDYLLHYPRFLEALKIRVEKILVNPVKDRELMLQVQKLTSQKQNKNTSIWQEYSFLLEELRVSFFAQQLGTSVIVSVKRLEEKLKIALQA